MTDQPDEVGGVPIAVGDFSSLADWCNWLVNMADLGGHEPGQADATAVGLLERIAADYGIDLTAPGIVEGLGLAAAFYRTLPAVLHPGIDNPQAPPPHPYRFAMAVANSDALAALTLCTRYLNQPPPA